MPNNRSLVVCLLTAFCFGGAAASSHAQAVLVSNLSQATSADTTLFTASTDRFAQAFTTDGQTRTLADIALNLELQDTAVSASDVLSLTLNSDGQGVVGGFLFNNSQPSATLAPLGNATVNSATSATYFFSAAASVTLAPNTTYWIVARDTGAASNISWDIENGAAVTGTGTLPTNSIASSGDGGSTWSVGATTLGPQKFQVRYVVASVPETATLPLLLLGALPLLARRRCSSASSSI